MYKRPEERNTHDAVELVGGRGGAAVSKEQLDEFVAQVCTFFRKMSWFFLVAVVVVVGG